MTQTVPNVESSSKSQAINGVPTTAQSATSSQSAQRDVILNAVQIYSDSKGAKRSYASDPLYGLEPDGQASDPSNPPLSSNRAFTLFDAIKSIGVLFNAEAAIGAGTMNMMKAVSGVLMHQLDQQQTYQNDIASINKSLKADQPPLIERIFEDIFLVGLGSILAFTFGGPAAGIAALAVGGVLDVLSQAKVFGSGKDKESFFQWALGKLPEGGQIAAKVAIAAALSLIIGGCALIPVSGVADAAADEVADVEVDEIEGEAQQEEQAQVQKERQQLPKAGKRFLALTISSLLTNGSKIDSALNRKLKDGEQDKMQLGLWGDMFKAMGVPEDWAGFAGKVFMAVGTIATMWLSGKFLGTVPTLESGAVQKRSQVLNPVMALGMAGTSLYEGAMGFKLHNVLENEANVRYKVDQLQKQLQSSEFLQHLAEQLNSRAISLNKNTMSAVWSVLGSFRSAVGLNQAV